jgi:hypothetical protein
MAFLISASAFSTNLHQSETLDMLLAIELAMGLSLINVILQTAGKTGYFIRVNSDGA